MNLKNKRYYYLFLVYIYRPKYKYGGFITEGHYCFTPKVFFTLSDAREFGHTCKHAYFIKKVRIYV